MTRPRLVRTAVLLLAGIAIALLAFAASHSARSAHSYQVQTQCQADIEGIPASQHEQIREIRIEMVAEHERALAAQAKRREAGERASPAVHIIAPTAEPAIAD